MSEGLDFSFSCISREFRSIRTCCLIMCDVNVRMDGKVVVITGGSSGIGLETAIELAKRGARVVLASRNETKLKNAREEIIHRSGNSNVAYKILDLVSLKSVRNFVGEVKTEDRLDVLINNAGSVGLPDRLTVDDLNLTMQVNFFGAFLLTYLVLPKLKASSPSRIINGSASSMYIGEIDFDHWNDIGRYSFVTSLANSKLAMTLFTAELHARLKRTGINVYSFDPFVVRGTDILENTSDILQEISRLLINVIGQTKQEAGKQIAFLASARELDAVSGKHYAFCKEFINHWLVNDVKLRKKLWDVSKKLVRIKPDEDWEDNI